MKPEKKKKYDKPKIKKISLDAECAVLSFCKTTSKIGAGVPAIHNCAPGGTGCSSIGS